MDVDGCFVVRGGKTSGFLFAAATCSGKPGGNPVRVALGEETLPCCGCD